MSISLIGRVPGSGEKLSAMTMPFITTGCRLRSNSHFSRQRLYGMSVELRPDTVGTEGALDSALVTIQSVDEARPVRPWIGRLGLG